jgi:hypothetical protein
MAFVQLINIAYIKQYTVVNDSVEANLANPAIKLAQDKFIKSYLGTNLYDKIIADVAAGTISGDYLDLLNDYIKPMLLWRTMVELYPSLYVKVQNGSIVLRTSDDTQTLDQSFINKLVADATNNAQHYTQDFTIICSQSTTRTRAIKKLQSEIITMKIAWFFLRAITI